ncbi:MAG: hypothetical protein ACFB01_12975 [Cohaesibacteraceae bacterium]
MLKRGELRALAWVALALAVLGAWAKTLTAHAAFFSQSALFSFLC